MAGHPVTFFLSTGRCGTQRIAYVLKSLFGRRIEVAHEPLGAAYAPKRLLRNSEYHSLIARQPRVLAHVEKIKEITTYRPYVETGWPCYGAIPYFRDIFGDRLRIVHLVRNPVHVALSLVTHRWYPMAGSESPKAVSSHFALGALTPEVPGVLNRGYREKWPAMNAYERALFHWTEVHAYACEFFDSMPSARRHFTTHEALTGIDTTPWVELCHFLGLGQHVGLAASLRKQVDSYPLRTAESYDWRAIYRHPETVRLADGFGYVLSEIDDVELARRYFP